MKKLIYIIATVTTTIVFSSCSKTLVLSDSNSSKEIKMYGKINIVSTNEGNFANFESIRGTNYHIDLSKYTYKYKSKTEQAVGFISSR